MYKKYINFLIFFIITLSFSSCTCVVEGDIENYYSKRIVLSGGNSLDIEETKDGGLTFSLSDEESIIKSFFRIDNALTNDDLIERALFDPEIGESLFITAYDRSSTYGAQTSIVLWQNNLEWEMISAPFVRAFLEDVDKDGVFEIIEHYPYPQKRTFRFDSGLFVEVK